MSSYSRLFYFKQIVYNVSKEECFMSILERIPKYTLNNTNQLRVKAPEVYIDDIFDPFISPVTSPSASFPILRFSDCVAKDLVEL